MTISLCEKVTVLFNAIIMHLYARWYLWINRPGGHTQK